MAISMASSMAIFGVMLMLAAPAAATGDFMAAGLLLVARDGDAAVILLGRDRSRPWFEMPGGRRQRTATAGEDQGERPETAYETAIREGHEESKGFLSRELLRRVTDAGRFIRDGGFVFFLGNIDKFPIDRLAKAEAPLQSDSTGFAEMVDYAWVPVDSVLASENAVVTDTSGRRIEVRRQLKSRLQQARSAGWL